MKREAHVLTVALLSAICISGYAFEPTAVAVLNNIVPSPTPSPRKKATPRPVQSPVTTRTRTRNKGSQVASPPADLVRTETVDHNESITTKKSSTRTSGIQPGGQQGRRTGTANRTSQLKAVKKNQDIEVENDETHVARPSNAGSNSASPNQISAQCVMNNKNCQEFEAVRNSRNPNRVSFPATNVKSAKSASGLGTPNKPVSGTSILQDGNCEEGEFQVWSGSPRSARCVRSSTNRTSSSATAQGAVVAPSTRKPRSKAARGRKP